MNVAQAAEQLDHADMIALSALFHDWAFDEPGLDTDQRTMVLMLSIDYEAIANFCGSGWQASDPSGKEDVFQFIARHARNACGVL